MYVAYLAVTFLAALANGYAASLSLVGAESVKVVEDRGYTFPDGGCSRSARWWPRARADS